MPKAKYRSRAQRGNIAGTLPVIGIKPGDIAPLREQRYCSLAGTAILLPCGNSDIVPLREQRYCSLAGTAILFPAGTAILHPSDAETVIPNRKYLLYAGRRILNADALMVQLGFSDVPEFTFSFLYQSIFFIRIMGKASFLQSVDHNVKLSSPEGPEPCPIAEPSHQCRAD